MTYDPSRSGDSYEGNTWAPQPYSGQATKTTPPPPGPQSQGSWGGFSPQATPTAGSGLSGAFAGPQGIGSEMQFILQGSSGAEAALRRGYEMMLREQAGGIAGGAQEDQRRTSATLTGGGVSPMLARLITRQRGQEAQGQYGAAVGGAGATLENSLAELEKSTGTELAGARQWDLGTLLKAKMGKDAANAAEPSGLDKLGQLAGIGGLAKLAFF